jgi:formylglycine-generating enzyme required for sulfatase activity
MIALAMAASLAAHVGPGTYRPVFPASSAEQTVEVAAFWLDREPVTNADFRAFVAAHPEWSREHVKPIFVDPSYLQDLSTAPAHAPVVHVSWFAARAYCAAHGGRLPREAEWELAAAADEHTRDASRDPAFQARVLAWYGHPTPSVLPDVGGAPNAWGVRDLHGLVWEWIDDFTSALVTTDSRDPTRSAVCGAEAAAAKDPTAYATFMRIAFRGALSARDTTGNLGFRCAYDQEPTP